MIQVEFFNEVNPKNGEHHISDAYIKVGPFNSVQWTYSLDFDLPNTGESVTYDGKHWGDFRICEYDAKDKTVMPFKAEEEVGSFMMIDPHNKKVINEVIKNLKEIEIDGESMQYILEKVGMEEQMRHQLKVSEK
jgi:hypothetical protein